MTLATDDLVIVRNAPDQRLLEEGVRPGSSDQERQPCPRYQIHRLVLQLIAACAEAQLRATSRALRERTGPPAVLGLSVTARQLAPRVASHRIASELIACSCPRPSQRHGTGLRHCHGTGRVAQPGSNLHCVPIPRHVISTLQFCRYHPSSSRSNEPSCKAGDLPEAAGTSQIRQYRDGWTAVANDTSNADSNEPTPLLELSKPVVLSTALPCHFAVHRTSLWDGTHDGKISVEVSRGLPLPSLGT